MSKTSPVKPKSQIAEANRRRLFTLVIFAASFVNAAYAQAAGDGAIAYSSRSSIVQAPLVIRFNGVLKDTVGDPISDATAVTLSIFETREGGTPLWTETQNVVADGAGRYTVLLGSHHPGGLPVNIFVAGRALWIEPEASLVPRPRQPLISVPYAVKASEADTLDGHSASDFLMRSDLPEILGMWLPQTSTYKVGVGPTPVIGEMPPETNQAKPNACNIFSRQQQLAGGAILPPSRNATPHDVNGIPSSGLDFMASAFDSRTGLANFERFRVQAEAVGSNTSAPTGRLSLLFAAKNNPLAETGFSINSDGTINFVPGQILPLSSIQRALGEAGLMPSATIDDGPGMPPVAVTSSYVWQQQSQAHKGGLHVGANTVTLTPCPAGVNGNDLWHYLWIEGNGNPEAVLITGGTCKSRAATGTVAFIAQYAHGAGYRIGTATAGVQEAVNDAVVAKSLGQGSRQVLISPGNLLFHARLSIRSSAITISDSGGTVVCEMKDTCIMLGDPSNANAFRNIVLQDILIAPAEPSGTWPAIEDSAQSSTLAHISAASGPNQNDTFGNMIQIDNDQAATIDGLNTNGGSHWGRCDIQFCSTAIVGSGRGSGVLWVENSNLASECKANGIDNQASNTLRVSNSVVEAYPQFGIRSVAGYSVNPAAQLDNVYEEIGNCQNPLQTGTAGVIVENGYAQVSGGEGPSGELPVFANSGTAVYYYFIVVHSSTMGVSPAYLAGQAQTNGFGRIQVVWNQVGTAGTISYDVLRVPEAVNGANTLAPNGTGNYAIATGVPAASCANQVCSVVDNAASEPSTYTVADNTNYAPSLWLWPASVVLTTDRDLMNTGGLQPTKYFTDVLTGAFFVNSAGALQPSVFAQQCASSGNWSSIWMQCLGGNAYSNDNPEVVGTLLQYGANGGNYGGLKGRLIFELTGPSSMGATEIITLADANPDKTLATPQNRPSWDPGDTYVGFDQTTPTGNSLNQLAFGAPVSMSQYIGHVPDGSNWLERLTAASKIFKVRVSVPALQTNSDCANAAGQCNSAPAGKIAIAPGQISVVVLTSSITAESEPHIDENFTFGPVLGVSCDTNLGRTYAVSAQIPGVGFTVSTSSAPTAGYACLSYWVTN